MLLELHIRNLAVVEDVSLSFTDGFNALTGSTGAGKSLVLGAVNLLLGHKSSGEAIRAGADRAEVRAILRVSPDRMPLEADGHADGRLEVRRVIQRGGRAQAWIGGKPVPVRQLGNLCRGVIEPHGQNEQFRLKDPENHVAYLDALASNENLRDAYVGRLSSLREAQRALAAFEARVAALKETRELLQHRVSEVERAALSQGEREQVERALGVMKNAERIHESIAFVLAAIYDEEGSVTEVLSTVQRRMEAVGDFDPALSAAAEHLAGAGVAVSECVDALRSLAGRLEFDPEEFQRLEERLDLLLTLESRYGMSCDQLIEASAGWREELNSIEFEGERRGALMATLDAAAAATQAAARALTKSRQAAAGKLDRQMTAAMEGLMMRGAAFRTSIDHSPDARSPVKSGRSPVALLEDGVDVVRFMVRTNPGQEEGPLERVASTGEVSRIALALKELTSSRRAGEVLIFDEIDAGIGADLGAVVGQKLLALSDHYQIICITHMPQVAARAHHHLVVIKESDDERASVRVETVDGPGRRSEIARMLGGAEGSERRRALAEELLQSGQQESKQARP